jgi:hypothetical protein
MKYHVTNTDNPVDFPVTKFVHIVYVHPVEQGEPNLHKVKFEKEFDTVYLAEFWIDEFNKAAGDNPVRAVYYGCVNDETGELV